MRREGDDLMQDTPEQDYVGTRDLARWPTAVGRAGVRVALRLSRVLAPHHLLVLTLLLGLAVIATLTWVAGEVYEAVVEDDGVAGLDQPVLDAAIHLRTGWGDAVVTAYTNLGGTVGMPILATATALLMAVRWRQWSPIVLVAATGLGTVALTVVGKAAVGRSRPPLSEAVPPYEHSFSFPSGHSLNSIAIAGIVAYLVMRRQQSPRARATTVTLAVTFAVTMGLSRVYLGHHWLTDVLVAWSLGLAWLTTVITAHRVFLTVSRHRRTA